MLTGSKFVDKSPDEVIDRLKLAMSGGNFEITDVTKNSITFKHGTVLTQDASNFPKKGIIHVNRCEESTYVTFAVEPVGFPTYWLTFIGIILCWLIFPPILAYRTLVYHPRKLMNNLLQCI